MGYLPQAVNVEEVIERKIKLAKAILKDEKFFVEDTALYLGKDKKEGKLDRLALI